MERLGALELDCEHGIVSFDGRVLEYLTTLKGGDVRFHALHIENVALSVARRGRHHLSLKATKGRTMAVRFDPSDANVAAARALLAGVVAANPDIDHLGL